MKTLTINTLAKKPKYGESFILNVHRPMNRMSPTSLNGGLEYLPSELCEYELTISGKGNHTRLLVGKEVLVKVLAHRERVTLRGFVLRRAQSPFGDESSSTFKVNAITHRKKRKGMWKVVARF